MFSVVKILVKWVYVMRKTKMNRLCLLFDIKDEMRAY